MLTSNLFNHFYVLSKQMKPTLVLENESAGLWWLDNFKLANGFDKDIEKLMALAFQANNLSSVFNVGYQFAIRAMFGKKLPAILQPGCLSCLCVSESGGNSPKAMLCYADQQGLTGVKTFVTCAPQVNHLLVLFDDQREHHKRDSKTLRIAFIQNARQCEGVTIIESDPARFLPNLDKGKVIIENLKLDDIHVLAEDAHEAYSKPFSILEGLYIRLACIAYLFKVCLLVNADKTLQSDVFSELSMLATLASADKQTPYYQLLLDAHARRLFVILANVESLLEGQDEDFKSQWNRDKVIFFIDTQLRIKRLEQAWQTIDTLCNP